MFGKGKMEAGSAVVSMDAPGLDAGRLEVLEALNRFQAAMCPDDVDAWFTLVDHVTVHARDDIRVAFRNGQEVRD